MYELEALEAAYLVEPEPSARRDVPHSAGSGSFERRLESLLRAKSRRYEACLNGSHNYSSDSEASMAVVDAMVLRHFTDEEIWRTLETSQLYLNRVEKKGERHARELYAAEIARARSQVTPFDEDPGAPPRPGRSAPNVGGAPDDELPDIVITGEYLRSLSAAAWSALERQNDPPRVFQHGANIAEVRRDEDGRHLIRDLSAAATKGRLDRIANWQRETKSGIVPARPPKDVIEDMMALEKPLPIIRGVVGTPIFRADGRLVTSTGFQRETGLFYAPVGDAVPPVPKHPSRSDLQSAKSHLDEWLYDLPFVDVAGFANTIAATLTPLAREMIMGPTPLGALDAPSPGTGKGLLAETMSIIVAGGSPAVMNDARQEDEIRKRITSLLREGHPMVLIDNVKRRLASPTLAALLTSTVWADRLLGGNDVARLPNRSQWLITGNNLDFDREIARRTVWIRLDSRVDQPWERDGFRHNPLAIWVRDHRHELVWALLVILQNWVALDRPGFTGKPMGSFESWCDVIGGALNAADIAGFLENRDRLYRQADTETEDWRAFVLAWWERFGQQAVKASELLAMVQREQLLLTLFATARDNATERSLVTRLGTALSVRRDRRFGQFFLRILGQDGHTKGTLYRLEQAPDAEPPSPSSQGSAEVPHVFNPDSDSNAGPAGPAEPEIHDNSMVDNDVVEPLKGSHKRGAVSTAIEVPQVPQHPQPDSETHRLGAEPRPRKGTKVPHEVPQTAPVWREEVG